VRLTASYRQWMALGLGNEAWHQWIAASGQLRFRGAYVVSHPSLQEAGEGPSWSVAYHETPTMEIFVARNLTEKRARDLTKFLNGSANFDLVKLSWKRLDYLDYQPARRSVD
jgi:hypothetical protein